MKIKNGAILSGLNIKMRPVLMIADELWRFHGQELVVTCGLDGCHSAGSLHYYGYALDFRTKYFNGTREREDIASELRSRLKEISSRYGVVFEGTHIHTQYKPYNLIDIDEK